MSKTVEIKVDSFFGGVSDDPRSSGAGAHGRVIVTESFT